MSNNTKLLIIFSLLIIVGGITLLVFGTRSQSQATLPSPTPLTFNQPTESTKSGVMGTEGELITVTKVIDGDTIVIEGDKHVRLIGVDTPETVDPKRPVGCWGKEASNEVKRLLTGQKVVLEDDVEDTDKYKRLLRYVYLPLPDGTKLFIDDYLIREGFGKTLNIPPDNRYADKFIEAQNQARMLKKGLWGSC